MRKRKRKLIDKIEYHERQMWRWLRIIFIVFLIVMFFLLVIKPNYIFYKEAKEANENLEKSRLLDKDCLTNIGKIVCENEGKIFGKVILSSHTFEGVFICYDNHNQKSKINITSKQLEECSDGKK